MDYTVLYIFLAIGISCGLAYLISYTRKKNVVKQEDLIFAMNILNLGMKVISEMRLDKELEIAKISEIIKDSLEYAISFYDTEQDVILNAIEYAYELCVALKVELTDSRKELIKDLIIVVFNDKYIQFIEE